ncbi:alpha-keto acid decarboxylase family protein [Priestia endophytica]|uniref:alpha-keto acid decarboxylase family protein n=1 Tax=Priestia endophytica TaxID=135735 RepID=UPI000DCA7F0D|nr:alpha-keto acid decarboxylase family protein [Priestia endophytica]RAS81001.1 pyruvate decarboxylase [Priestia endophytica]
MKKDYTIGDYLLDRLAEIGVHHVFGVPGDYNLMFLDEVLKHKELEWIGNCNELNAAYAADGYARLNGIGAVMTTFGVGELSAVNGIAGSYAEHVPIVKVTGAPTTKVMKEGSYVHHTLGDGNFHRFSTMFREVTCAQTILTVENASQEIDRVLLACLTEKKPVHIVLPIDIYNKPANKPNKKLLGEEVKSNEKAMDEMLTNLLMKINKAKKPVILADYEVYRYKVEKELMYFAEKSGFPIATLSMGKGVFDETHPQFIGVYNGDLSDSYIKQRIDESDCIISVGVKLTDSITGGFSQGFSEEKVIHLHPLSVEGEGEKYAPLTMKDTLNTLAHHIKKRDREEMNIISIASREQQPFEATDEKLTQTRFFERLSHFIKEDDVLLADQGTSFFGAATMPLKKGGTFIGQPLWGSIGYTLPAILGSQLADKERRNILLIGDGSFQLTAQELSTIIYQKIKPIIFLINNDGYTVERAIHGENKSYNDIVMWDYEKLPSIFGPKEASETFKVQTEQELDDMLNKIEHHDKLIFAEIKMNREDKPELLTELSKRFSSQNS